nr:ATP-binding protein [Corynebacterium aquatimens]
MSLEFENYRSFREPAVLDMQLRSFHTLHPKDPDWRGVTQRQAAIFGPNASGKTTIIELLSLLGWVIPRSVTSDHYLKHLRDPFGSDRDRPTSISAEYVYEDVRYRWAVVLDDDGVLEESLDAAPTSRWRRVFTRGRGEVSFGASSGVARPAQEIVGEFLQPWVLALSALARVKNPGPFIGATKWWGYCMPVHSVESDRNIRHKWLTDLISSDVAWFNFAKIALAAADFGITDLEVNEAAVPEEIKLLVQKISELQESDSEEAPKVEVENAETIVRYLEFVHSAGDETFTLSEKDESNGTLQWLDLIIPAAYCLLRGGVFLVDELDSGLHPDLVRLVLELFNREDTNPRGAQIIFNSHDITLLGNHGEPAVDKDCAWLVEKHHGESELLSLDEFQIRKNHNIEKRYMQGAFGAKPFPSIEVIAREIEKLEMESA